MSANLQIPKPPKVIAPPFTHETATQKVRLAEDAWNSRDPDRVALAYTEDSCGGTGASSSSVVIRFGSSWPESGVENSITA